MPAQPGPQTLPIPAPVYAGTVTNPCSPEYFQKYIRVFGRKPDCTPAIFQPPPPPQPVPQVIPVHSRRRNRHPLPPRHYRRRLPPLPLPQAPPLPAGETCPERGWVTRPCGNGYKVFACSPGQPVNINPAFLCPASQLSGFFDDCGLGDCSDPNIQAKIFAYADQYGIDRNVALAQIKQESGCRSTVCSSAGACGIAQFIPDTWARYGGGGDRNDVDASLSAWGTLMRHLLDLFKGDYRLALAGYHSGEGAAQAALNNPSGNPKTNQYVNAILGNAGGASPSGGSFVLGTTAMLGIGGLLLLFALRR